MVRYGRYTKALRSANKKMAKAKYAKYRSKASFRQLSAVNTKAGSMVTVPTFGGIPARFKTRLCYDDTYTGLFDGAGLTVFENFFRLNSLYDFDYTNNFGNFQPGGRDRLANLYSFVTVRKVHLTFELTHTNEGVFSAAPSVQMAWVSWQADSGSILPAVPSYPRMLPGSRVTNVARDTNKKLKVTIDVAKLSGMGGSVFSSGTGAVVGTNPGNPIWGDLLVTQNYVTGGEHNTYAIHMRAVFDCEYAGPKKAELDTN